MPSGIKLVSMDSAQKSPSGVTFLENGDALTVDGLKLKHMDAIEMINVRLEDRNESTFYSWQVCRLVRRDFNFVAPKLFHREKRKNGREEVRSLIHEVRLQADLLVDECKAFAEPPKDDGMVVPVRLVSPAAASLFRALVIADGAFARLNYAVKQNELAQNLVHSYTQPFENAFSDLKMYCSKRNQEQKSALELASAQGIV